MFQKEGYPLDWLQELKDKNNIVEVISRYIPLKPAGGNFWGCCPFHHEKTPSFAVREDEKYYHCFGCGKSGDVITFIQEIEGLSFPEAVEMLAERAGMEVPKLVSNNNNNFQNNKKMRDKCLAILKETAKFYHSCLMSKEGENARKYLEERQITNNLITKYGLGYSPDFNRVIKMLNDKGYKNDEIIASGVGWTKKDGKGEPFDALQGRLIVPIFDAKGDVCAFSGRAIQKDYKMGKYVHYHNTIVFDKSKIIYGANFVKNYKIKEPVDKVIIVEGYMDVMSLYKFGYPNAVAGMGTAFTPGQARVLANLSNNVYVCYDGDSAGQEAALKNLKVLNDAGLDMHVITMPDGLDPDDFLKKYGKKGFESLVQKALPYVEYVLSRIEIKHNMKTSTGRAKYVKEALDFIGTLFINEAQQEVYLQIIHDKSRVDMDILRSGTFEQITESVEETLNNPSNYELSDGDTEASRFVLNIMVSDKKFSKPQDIISINVFGNNEVHKQCYEYIQDVYNHGQVPKGHMLYSLSQDEEIANILNTVKEFSDETKLVKYYNDCVTRLNKKYLVNRVAELSQQFDNAQDDDRKQLLKEIIDLQNQLRKL